MIPTFSSPSLSVAAVGERFLQHYQTLGYRVLPGSSLLHLSLPMTFVMSAGMVQFELLANKNRDGDRFTLIQRCFRHFDIERTGESEIHLSLFHMPGAFHFGKISRKHVIEEIWHLLLDVYGFHPENLAVTYFSGGEMDGTQLPEDTEAAQAWQSVGLPAEKLFGLSVEANYWRQSAHMVGVVNSRKSGPNTEVFYDCGAEYACGPGCRPGCLCGRFIEFSNTLLIENYIDENGCTHPLDEPFTEVVIGQERVAMLLQGTSSVYEIETVAPLVDQVQCFSVPGTLSAKEVRHYEHIMADHLRALLFLTKDGAPPPGRGGRARLMRILVREFLTAREMLGITESSCLRSLLYTAGELYPEMRPVSERVRRFINEENIRFQDTLRKGLEHLIRQIQRDKGIDIAAIRQYKNQYGIPPVLLSYHLARVKQRDYAK